MVPGSQSISVAKHLVLLYAAMGSDIFKSWQDWQEPAIKISPSPQLAKHCLSYHLGMAPFGQALLQLL